MGARYARNKPWQSCGARMVCAGGANAVAALVRRRTRRAHQRDRAPPSRRAAAFQRVRADDRLPADTRDHPSSQPSPRRAVWRDKFRPHRSGLDRVVPPLDVNSSTRPEPEARAGQTARQDSAAARIDPQARAVMEYLAGLGLPPIDKIPPTEARRQYREVRAALRPPAPNLLDVRDLKPDGKGGPIPLRLYRPALGVLPAFVFFHGGGWVVGDLETHDVVCRQIARDAGVVVIAVDYRLAPEHPFPAASDDAWSATTWIAAHAGELEIDPSRIAVGGDSAGAGLAAVVALMARDSRKWRLAFQVLVYPVVDLRAESGSYSKYADGYLLTRSAMRWYIAQYARTPQAVNDWHASPLLAPWVHGVAPALILTAELDPLIDEGEAFARRLRGARVPVDYQVVPGMVHGYLTMGGKVDAANHSIEVIASALRGI